jgi:Carboxypeptidase regulatory-like domain/Bacterial Ig-like domain (group 2)
MYKSVGIAATLSLVSIAVACSSSSPSGASAASPTPVSTAAVRSIHVIGAPNSYIVVGDTAQFLAMANMADGTSSDVTQQATWSTSDPTIFAVGAGGKVTALKVGSADIRATWQSFSDKDYTTAQPFLTFTAYGTVTEAPPDFAALAGARVSIAPGAVADVVTDAAGNYTFPPLKGGPYTITVRHDGFVAQTRPVTLTRDTRADFPLLPVPPGGATARCKDRSWSFTTDRASACARNGGVAYFVCPGPLCQP